MQLIPCFKKNYSRTDVSGWNKVLKHFNQTNDTSGIIAILEELRGKQLPNGSTFTYSLPENPTKKELLKTVDQDLCGGATTTPTESPSLAALGIV